MNELVATFACGVLIGSAAMLLATALQDAKSPLEATQTVYVATSEVLPYAEPKRIRIPSVGIDAVFEAPLGVTEDGAIEVPKAFDTVAWYKHGPTPGERGPSIVLGHVDSYEGPEVFHPLKRLDAGEKIYIDREDGSTATFVVTKLQAYPQSGFPTGLVYGDLEYAGLRLITCSGSFDYGAQRYSHNLIVFAVLVEA